MFKISDEEMQALVAQAEATARQQMKWKNETVFEHWTKKRIKNDEHIPYNEQEATREKSDDDEQEQREIAKHELAQLVAAKKHKAEIMKKGREIFFKTFVIVSVDDEQSVRDWNGRFKDPISGHVSPAFRQLAEEQYGWTDALALTDPARYAQIIAEKFERKIIKWDFDRRNADAYAYAKNQATDELRWFKAEVMLRQKHVPPKI